MKYGGAADHGSGFIAARDAGGEQRLGLGGGHEDGGVALRESGEGGRGSGVEEHASGWLLGGGCGGLPLVRKVMVGV